MAWADSMASLNESLLGTFPDKLTFNAAKYPCIAPPVERLKKMTQGPYDANATATFQMREDDRATAGITTRSAITNAGLTFEVYSIARDPNDTLVRLTCNLKQ